MRELMRWRYIPMHSIAALFWIIVLVNSCTANPPVPGDSPSAQDYGVCAVGTAVSTNVYCALNPAVTQNTIFQTICVSGWTSTIRPPVSYTNPIKLHLISIGQNLHNGDTISADYELDHRMPLELGGAPSDLNNLSIEYPRINPKDQNENFYKAQVCAGTMSLMQAQKALVDKWLNVYPGYKA